MEQSEKQAEPSSTGVTKHPAVFCLMNGLFAGIIWGLFRWLAVALNFTKVPQAFLADPFVKRSSLDTIMWHCMGFVLFVVMSIAAAYVYWLVLGKLKGPWPGLLFGAVWWAMLFTWIGPLTGAIAPIRTLGWNTIFSELSLYLMWGLFIGYSYAFEFHNEAEREPAGQASAGKQPQPAS